MGGIRRRLAAAEGTAAGNREAKIFPLKCKKERKRTINLNAFFSSLNYPHKNKKQKGKKTVNVVSNKNKKPHRRNHLISFLAGIKPKKTKN